MNYRDRWATDEKGNRFVFSVEMQRELAARGLPVDPAYLPELQSGAGGRVRLERAARETPPAPQAAATQTSAAEMYPPAASRFDNDETEPESIQIDPLTGKYVGRLKWYNPLRGYGFIARGGGEDIFFHKTDVLVDADQLSEGQWVLYDVEETSKGLEASEIEFYEGGES
ncbi:MAG: hypothetical protein Fur0021_11460 [Candidatus Promineifilaceae bacterium]